MPTRENALRYIPEHTGKRLEFVGWCMFWIALLAGGWTTYYFGELPDLGSALSGRPGRTFRSWQLTGLYGCATFFAVGVSYAIAKFGTVVRWLEDRD